MAATIEEIERDIQAATAAGFRGSLLARGQARSIIWRDGVLPEDAPPFSPLLSYDLLSYGYSLLGMGLRLLELEGNPDNARLAFEHAAGATKATTKTTSPRHLMFWTSPSPTILWQRLPCFYWLLSAAIRL